MIVGFIFELNQPLLFLSLMFHGRKEGASIILGTDFHGLILMNDPMILSHNGRHIHKGNRFLRPKLLSKAQVFLQGLFHFLLKMLRLHGNLIQHRLKGRMPTMVTPVAIQDVKLRFTGVSFFFPVKLLNKEEVFPSEGKDSSPSLKQQALLC